MIIVTSLSPNHSNKDQQHLALKSWYNVSRFIYSMNCMEEIDFFKTENYDGVEFLSTTKTIEHFVNRPLVNINAMIDVAINRDQDLLLVNSDIIFSDLPELKTDVVTIFSRYDYTDTFEDRNIFKAGFDVFHIPNQFLRIFPPSIYGIGAAWWDYWVLFHCMKRSIPVYYPEGVFAFHKVHPTQYSIEEWYYIGEYFKLEFKLPKLMNIGQVATSTLAKIKAYLT